MAKVYYVVQAYEIKEDEKYKTHIYPNYLTSYDLKMGGNNFGLQSGLYDALKFEAEADAKKWENYAASVFSERTWEIVPVDSRILGKVTPMYIVENTNLPRDKEN